MLKFQLVYSSALIDTDFLRLSILFSSSFDRFLNQFFFYCSGFCHTLK